MDIIWRMCLSLPIGLILGTCFGMIIGIKAANVRGFSSLAGAIVGALLGPLALLLFLCGKGTRHRCPYCAEWIQKRAHVCPHCQRDLKG